MINFMGTECSVMFQGQVDQPFKSLVLELSTEASIKAVLVLSCPSFPPTDSGISVGEKKGFLHPTSPSLKFLPVSLQHSPVSFRIDVFLEEIRREEAIFVSYTHAPPPATLS